jgi:threonyl-tRNA synthetase
MVRILLILFSIILLSGCAIDDDNTEDNQLLKEEISKLEEEMNKTFEEIDQIESNLRELDVLMEEFDQDKHLDEQIEELERLLKD